MWWHPLPATTMRTTAAAFCPPGCWAERWVRLRRRPHSASWSSWRPPPRPGGRGGGRPWGTGINAFHQCLFTFSTPTSLLRMRLRGNGSPSPLCLVPEDAFSTSSSGSRGGGSGGGGPQKQQHFFNHHQTLQHRQFSPYENFLVYAEPIYASVTPSTSEFDASISPRTFPFQK